MKSDLLCSFWKTSVGVSGVSQFSHFDRRAQSFKVSVLKQLVHLHLYRQRETGSGGVKAAQLKVLSSLLIFAASQFLQSHYFTSYSTIAWSPQKCSSLLSKLQIHTERFLTKTFLSLLSFKMMKISSD